MAHSLYETRLRGIPVVVFIISSPRWWIQLYHDSHLPRFLFKPEELETLALRFSVKEKHFENGDFRKRWGHYNHEISLPEVSSNANLKWPVIVRCIHFPCIVWTEKHSSEKMSLSNIPGVARDEALKDRRFASRLLASPGHAEACHITLIFCTERPRNVPRLKSQASAQ